MLSRPTHHFPEMSAWSLVFFFSSFLTVSNPYKILAILPTNSVSHFRVNERLFTELAKRGHEIDVVSHFPRKQPLKGYTDISIVGSQPPMKNQLPLTAVFPPKTFLHMSSYISSQLGAEACRSIFRHESMLKLRNSTKHYDLLIVELFSTDCMLGFAHHFSAPIVATISSVSMPWCNDRIGNPDNPAYVPNFFSSFTSRMGLVERLVNTVQVTATKFQYEVFYGKESNAVAKEFFGESLPDLHKLAYNTSVVLVNSHFSINGARPMVPNFVEIGGIHINEMQPLPKHFQDILEENSCVILFTMGSMLQTETFTVEKLENIFSAFEEINCAIIFKGDKKEISKTVNIPKNVYIHNWIPQQDMLCHPNLKVFITHGGLLSSLEAVYCAVPIIGIPMFSDQFTNVKQFEEKEIGFVLLFEDIVKERLLHLINSLLDDSKYSKNMKKISEIYKDRQNTPLETAVYWVEYVAKYKGAMHLRSFGADLPWYQYHLIDVTFILLGTLATIFGIISLIARYVYNKYCNRKVEKIKRN